MKQFANRREAMKKKMRIGIIAQVALLFAAGVLTIGVVTFFSQRLSSDRSVRTEVERIASADAVLV